MHARSANHMYSFQILQRTILIITMQDIYKSRRVYRFVLHFLVHNLYNFLQWNIGLFAWEITWILYQFNFCTLFLSIALRCICTTCIIPPVLESCNSFRRIFVKLIWLRVNLLCYSFPIFIFNPQRHGCLFLGNAAHYKTRLLVRHNSTQFNTILVIQEGKLWRLHSIDNKLYRRLTKL